MFDYDLFYENNRRARDGKIAGHFPKGHGTKPYRSPLKENLTAPGRAVKVEFAIPYEPEMICGFCGYAAKYHFESAEEREFFLPTAVCSREKFSFNYENAVAVEPSESLPHGAYDLDAYGLPVELPYNLFEDDEGDDTEQDTAWLGIENYRDLDANEQTVTLDQYRKGARPSFSFDHGRSAYVEGQEGYLILNFLDEDVTKKFHFKLLNFFHNKYTGKYQVGGIAFSKNTDGSISGSCTHEACKKLRRENRAGHTLTINISQVEATVPVPYDPKQYVRKAMEDFIYACIRHGNNHAAKWFTERDTFYKLHDQSCDLSCDPKSAYCIPANVPVTA